MNQPRPLNFHVQTLNLTINGTPPESIAMPDTLRVIGSDGASTPAPAPVGELAGLADHIVAQLFERLHEPPTEPTGSPATLPMPSVDARINTPGVTETPPATEHTSPPLPELFDQFQARTNDQKTASSWSSYRTLIRKWRQHFDGDGPPANQLTPPQIQNFFESVPEWKTRRTWLKYAEAFWQIINGACPVSLDNRNGAPVDSATLQTAELPAWFVPPARWFRDRIATTPAAPDRPGGHTPSNLPPITIDEFGALLDATESAEFMAPLWWQTFFSLLWFNAPRRNDAINYQYETGQLHVALKRRRLEFIESKKGNRGAPYLPPWLYDLLTALQIQQISEDRPGEHKHEPGAFVFIAEKGTRHKYGYHPEPRHILPRGDAANEGRKLKPEFCRLFKTAGVELRHPHDWRNTAVSNWINHASEFRFAAIGHAPPQGDTQLRNYARFGDPYREACESYPYPDRWTAQAATSTLILPPGL